MMKDDLYSKDAVVNSMKKLMTKDDVISRSALLDELRKQVPYAEDDSPVMEIIERQPPVSDNGIEHIKVILERDADEERLRNIIMFLIMMGIMMFLAAVLY